MIVTLKSLAVRNSKKLWKILRVQELRLVVFVILHLNKCSVTFNIFIKWTIAAITKTGT